ncbi:MAG: transposase [Phycisphaerales bacterium]|nr:transposase [Phycisphaerales bacterium]
MRDLRFAGGEPVCEHCGSDRIGEVKTRRLLRCKDCRKMLYTKKGTIFEDSPLGLDKWFVAVWAIANCKNGISSHELARTIGVNQKSAWFMLQRIRDAMQTDDFHKFDGPAEADTNLRRRQGDQYARAQTRRHAQQPCPRPRARE